MIDETLSEISYKDLDTALLHAVLNGDLCQTESLIKAGANVNAKGLDDWTPLMEACSKRHVECASYLMRHGANLDVPEESDILSPVWLIAKTGDVSLLMLAMDYISKTEMSLREAMQGAACSGSVECIKCVEEMGGNVLSVDEMASRRS